MTEFFHNSHFAQAADQVAFDSVGDLIDVIESSGFRSKIRGTIDSNSDSYSPGDLDIVGEESTATFLASELKADIVAVDAGEGFVKVSSRIDNRDGTVTYRLTDCPYEKRTPSRGARCTEKPKRKRTSR